MLAFNLIQLSNQIKNDNFLSSDSQAIVALCGGQGGTSFDPVQRVTGSNPRKKRIEDLVNKVK